MIWIIAFALFWIVCGLLAYGITYGYLATEIPLLDLLNRAIAGFVGIIGPVGLVISFIGSRGCRHGLMYRNPHKPKQMTAKQLAKRIANGEEWELKK